jgi:AcrR family transcriptional regulator
MPRPDVSDARRAQIREAATVVFSRLGFQQARMDDVAVEARLSKGALYLYFDSKDAIIAGLMRDFFDAELSALHAALAAPGPVLARLRSLRTRMRDDLERMRALLPMAWEFYAIAGRRDDVRALCRAYLEACRDPLVRLIEDGIASGELRAVDPEVAALAIAALYEGFLVLWMTDPDGLHPDRQGQAAFDLLLDGLRAKGV